MIYLDFVDNGIQKITKSVQVVRCLTIGRNVNADIRLQSDPTISNLHALAVPTADGRLELRDLSSTTGTFVVERGTKRRLMPVLGKGGAEKGRAVLAYDECFYIGRCTVKLRYQEVLGEPTIQDIEEEITENKDVGEL